MGAYHSHPLTPKCSPGEENDRIKYAVSSIKGLRSEMRDAHAAILDLDGSKSTSFFGVYDGHGGAEVALYCSRQFHVELASDEDYDNNLHLAMEHAYLRIDENLQKSDEWRELAYPPGKGNVIRFPRIDDCFGNFLPWKAINLSTDHKPNHQDERERIEAAGGQLVRTELGLYFINDEKIAISRAIGDFQHKQNKTLLPAQQIVTCNPDICTVNITNDANFLLIASDGVWDVMTSQQAVDFVCQYLRSGETDLRAICEALLDSCVASVDNSTVILVQFKGGAEIMEGHSSGATAVHESSEIVQVQPTNPSEVGRDGTSLMTEGTSETGGPKMNE